MLAEDTGALLGILIALAGTLGAQVLGRPELDGAASIAIGVLLGLIAIVLARETKGLLIGEPASSELISSICTMSSSLIVPPRASYPYRCSTSASRTRCIA